MQLWRIASNPYHNMHPVTSYQMMSRVDLLSSVKPWPFPKQVPPHCPTHFPHSHVFTLRQGALEGPSETNLPRVSIVTTFAYAATTSAEVTKRTSLGHFMRKIKEMLGKVWSGGFRKGL